MWGTGADTCSLFSACLRVMAEDPAVAVTALAVDLVTEFDGDTAYADAILKVARNTDAPLAVLTSVSSAVDPATAQRLRDNGIPVMEGFRSGLAALGHLANWPLPVDPPVPSRRQARTPEVAEPFDILAAFGMPVVESRVAPSLDEALAAANAVGFPIALKTRGAEHKTDVGGVALRLSDAAELRDAYTAMADALGPAVTVQPMVDGGVEVSVGFVRDDAFGPLVIVAAGGTLVELLATARWRCRR